jgi:DNA-binding CsgD family transcriptional regulator
MRNRGLPSFRRGLKVGVLSTVRHVTQPQRTAPSELGLSEIAVEPERLQGGRQSPAVVGILVVDSSGTVLFANAEGLRLLGHPADSRGQLEPTLWRVLRPYLFHSESNETGWCIRFVSGKRRYRCCAIPVGSGGERRVAIVIARAGPNAEALDNSSEANRLTRREREAVVLLANGCTNKEIAAQMGVSVNTVRAFMRSVMSKLSLTTRAGVIGRLFGG